MIVRAFTPKPKLIIVEEPNSSASKLDFRSAVGDRAAKEEGNPGYYSAKFFLRPHYQLESQESFAGLNVLTTNYRGNTDPSGAVDKPDALEFPNYYTRPYFGLNSLVEGASRRLGEEIIAAEGEADGSFFNDVIIASGSTSGANGGFGDDIVVLTEGSSNGARVVDGGGGADTYVVRAQDPKSATEECLIFDLSGDSWTTVSAGNNVVLTGFTPSATEIHDLGDGRVRAVDLDTGLQATFRIERPNGKAVEFETIKDSITIALPGEPIEVGKFSSPLLIIAEDVEGEVLAGTRASETFFVDRTVSEVKAGRGSDVIIADLSEPGGSAEIMLDGQGGADRYVLLFGTEPTVDFAEECLIFDYAGGGLSPRTTFDRVYLPDFGLGSTVQDSGNGQFKFFDPRTELTRTIGLEWDDGEGLEGAEVLDVLANPIDFVFLADLLV